ncbi:site-specific integrase [Parasedimentitalea psychrophila]|uniref:Integrase n=1 Tax=Parasedimentitalea psychrophila TaxID=2997337 RepID=A0A9Y2P3G0_9RHOB|nr:integrase [Parasedimentitalea psychrophila]WIY24239.1 integrase [Parasedimentitalea psychrophila]
MELMRRGKKGLFTHKRPVPTRYREIEGRAYVWTALHTDARAEALQKARAIVFLQDAQWEAALAKQTVKASALYAELRTLAQAMGFAYLPEADVADLPDKEFLQRVEAGVAGTASECAAVLGAAEVPKLLLSGLFDAYAGFVADKIRKKDAQQLRKWRSPRLRAVTNLIGVIGDMPVQEITRQHALTFRAHWWSRMQSEGRSAATGNHDLGNLSSMVSEVCMKQGWDMANPFLRLWFEPDGERRPAFSAEWISSKILAPGALDNMSDEERAIFLVVVNTGARPSEIINLLPERIRLDANIPHIQIRAEGRTLKNKYSSRDVPLLGVSLEAMRAFPDGFPRYRTFGDWTDHATGHLRDSGLLESDKHTAYSLRHSISDRLLNSGCQDRVRKEIMGHKPEKMIYGEGSNLDTKLAALAPIALV